MTDADLIATSEITVGDGKYTVLHENGKNLRALRYGEAWREMTGDGLILALVQEIQASNEREGRLREANDWHPSKEQIKQWCYDAANLGADMQRTKATVIMLPDGSVGRNEAISRIIDAEFARAALKDRT